MKKLLIQFLFFSSIAYSSGQSLSDGIQEFNFHYTDSIDSTVIFGDYDPKGFVILNDGSLIIGTEFSIYFPYEYSSKSHISSGSILKLNHDFQKVWEIVFKNKRVEGIKKLSDGNIIVVGERVDMKLFWIAKINDKGKILFEKDYYFKKHPNIANMEIDSLDNIFLLLNCERLYPIKYYSNQNHRLRFFQVSGEENDLYLLKINANGQVQWKTSIDKRTNFSTYGYEDILIDRIYIHSSYVGFVKKKKEWIRNEGEMIYELDFSGKVLRSYPIYNRELLNFKNKLLSCTAAKDDTLLLYSYSEEPADTIIFPSEVSHFWINKAICTPINNYILGTSDHNLGWLVVKLTAQNKFSFYWTNKNTDYSSLVDGLIAKDNSIILLTRANNRKKDDSLSYIRIIKIESNGK